MPKIPEFKISKQKSYYRRKEIKRFISQIDKNLGMNKQAPLDENAAILEQVKDLLTQLVAFRTVTDPKKFSSKDHSTNNENFTDAKSKVDEIIQTLRELQETVKDSNSIINKAINYAIQSMALRTEHLEKKQLITQTETDIENFTPIRLLQDWEDSEPAPQPQPKKNPDCFIPPEAYSDEPPRVDVKSNLTLLDEIGSGQFGKVYTAKAIGVTALELRDMGLIPNNDGIVVVKVLKNPNERSLLAFKKEAILADKIREAALRGGPGSNNVSLNTFAIDDKGELLIVGKREERGRLTEFLVGQFFDLNTPAANKIDMLRKIYRQQKEGLLFLHANNFLHCDFALRNILIDANGRIKISDFGLAQQITSDPNAETSHGAGAKVPGKWYSAKSLSTARSDRDNDIFSLKVTMLEEFATMITGNHTAIWRNPPAEEWTKWHKEVGDKEYLKHLVGVVYDFIKNPEKHIHGYTGFYTEEDKALYIDYLKEICATFNLPRPDELKQLENPENTQPTAPAESASQSETPTQPSPAVEPEVPDYPVTSVRERAASYANPSGQQKNKKSESEPISKLASSQNQTVRQAFSLFQTNDNLTKNKPDSYVPQPKDTKPFGRF